MEAAAHVHVLEIGPLRVVKTSRIRLPDVQLGIGDRMAFRVDDAPGDQRGRAGVLRRNVPAHRQLGRTIAMKRSEHRRLGRAVLDGE